MLDILTSRTAILRLKTSNGRACTLPDVTFYVTGFEPLQTAEFEAYGPPESALEARVC